MKTKIIQYIPILLVFIAIGFSEFSTWCTAPGNACFRTFLDRLIPNFTYPAYFFVLYLLPLTLILIFVSRNIFISWLKFAAWAIPLAALYIWLTPVSGGGDLISFTRDDAARLTATIFTILSLVLISYKYFISSPKQ